MPFNWGSALTQFGKDIPGIGSAYDNMGKLKRDEEDRQRQAILDDLTAEKDRVTLGALVDSKKRQGEGRKALGDYFSGVTLDESLGAIKGLDEVVPIYPKRAYGPGTTPVKTEYRKPDINKVLPYMDDPAVKGALEYGLDKERVANAAKAKGADAAGGVFDQGSREYELAKRIANGQITWEQGLQAFVGFGNKTGKREDLVNTIFEINPDFKSATTQGQYRAGVTEEQIPAEVKKKSAVTTAGNLAPEKLPVATIGDLTTSQGIYANLNNAKEKFKTSFATPFAGKVMKLGYMRRTNPEFASYMSSLGLAMNEYRRQNFGTAQTDSEIQNFLDVISTDSDITPEAFQRQLDVVTNSMGRDYSNKTANLGGAGYVVPEPARRIENPTVREETKQVMRNGVLITVKKVAGGWQQIQ